MSLAGGTLLSRSGILTASTPEQTSTADYTLSIATTPIEIAPNRILSLTTYNGQFPGPLLRFKEGQPVTVDIYNQTDTPELLHWHGQMIPSAVEVKRGERVLFHIVNGSAGEIRSLVLPGHTFTILATDGNPLPVGSASPASGSWAISPTTTAVTAWASWSSTRRHRASPGGSPPSLSTGTTSASANHA